MLACGSLGLIGLSQFLQFTVFGSQPISAVFAVFVRSFLPALTPQGIFIPSKSCLSFTSFRFSPLRSFVPALAFPPKHLQAKNSASPAAKPLAVEALTTFRATLVCHPRSTRSRLAPLHYAGKKTTPLLLRLFFTASFRLKAALPVFGLNPASPTHSPRPPTPEEMQLNISL